MHHVTEEVLNQLRDAGNYKALDIALFALCVGVFVTGFATVTTVDNIGNRLLITFVAVTVVTGIMSVFFGVRAIIAWRKAKSAMKQITQRG